MRPPKIQSCIDTLTRAGYTVSVAPDHNQISDLHLYRLYRDRGLERFTHDELRQADHDALQARCDREQELALNEAIGREADRNRDRITRGSFKILRHLRGHGPTSRNDLRTQVLGRHCTRDLLDQILAQLQEDGTVTVTTVPGPGRPTQMWHLTPEPPSHPESQDPW